MGQFVKGDVVVVPFPFSDLTSSKRRPALVVATLPGDDVILCQITGRTKSDGYSVPITPADCHSGTLHRQSNVRPNRLFTGDSKIIRYRAFVLSSAKVQEVVAKIIQILTSP